METVEGLKTQALGNDPSSVSVFTDVESQRLLKQKLDQEEKEKKAQAKEEADQKKQSAAEKALKKAQEKFEKAQAKALAIQKRLDNKGCKRKLDPKFAEVDDKKEEPASPEDRKKRTRNPKAKSKPSVALSPKAKAFANSSCSNQGDKGTSKAQQALQTLRNLNIPDLNLPGDDFNRKFLIRNSWVHQM